MWIYASKVNANTLHPFTYGNRTGDRLEGDYVSKEKCMEREERRESINVSNVRLLLYSPSSPVSEFL
jgi:hypothetical protein